MLLLQRSFQPQVSQTPLAYAFVQPQRLRLRFSRLRLDAAAPSQLLLADGCALPLQLQLIASPLLLSAIALVQPLQFSQIPVCLLLLAGGCALLLLQLLVVQLQLSGTTRLRLRSYQILISRNTVSVVQQPQPVLVLLQQQSPATVSRIPVFRTTSARTPKSSAVAPFLRPLPPFGRLQPTCIVLVHKRCVHFQFSPVQLSSARVDVAAFK